MKSGELLVSTWNTYVRCLVMSLFTQKFLPLYVQRKPD